ncbi:MAG: hypothetical protein ACAH06_05105 [Methylophilaceae bacterium]|jgi:hypothetical protein|uniref:hypothetical protein n=1 Tax=Methylobacillus sp. MM3 TaxID=1848039 RepID=UPI0007E29C81|nr:hypothetical protein [Methylobacillus sp. MM3]OAJ71392.1 hypothetical protein A7976_07635 [Methylobacillus sp. MM3]
MEINCYRNAAFATETRFLPAETYNLAVTLLAHEASGQLFVPIRSMQYLAIIDHEEFVFIDGERKCWVDIAWQKFKPQTRSSLVEPVQYEAVYYRLESIDWMRRLQSEFPLALRQFAAKEKKPSAPAKVLKFPSG